MQRFLGVFEQIMSPIYEGSRLGPEDEPEHHNTESQTSKDSNMSWKDDTKPVSSNDIEGVNFKPECSPGVEHSVDAQSSGGSVTKKREKSISLPPLTEDQRRWIKNLPDTSVTIVPFQTSAGLKIRYGRLVTCQHCAIGQQIYRSDALVKHYRNRHNLYIVHVQDDDYAILTPDELSKFDSEIIAERDRLEMLRSANPESIAIKVEEGWLCLHCGKHFARKWNPRRHLEMVRRQKARKKMPAQ